MKQKHLFHLAGLGMILAWTAGCANHIRNLETTNNESEQNVLSSKYNFTLSQDPPRDTTFTVTIEKLEQVDVKNFEIRTIKSYSTPYSFWRELYEVPSGIGLLPVSLGAHVLFLLSIGMFPYDIPHSINDLAFTGMNPCLNWESESRMEEELIRADKKMLNRSLETRKTPVMKTPVLIQAGDFSRTIATDDFGSFTVHFLSNDPTETFFPLARKVSFFLASEPDKSLKHIILTREFLARLLKARSRINAYKVRPSGRKLMETIIELEKMKFDQLAYALEEAELKKYENNARFQKEFQDAAQE